MVDKEVVFLWTWIPNQQHFSFRRFFQHAIPNLTPKWARDRVVFIMKDGDAQHQNEICIAMTTVFLNVIEGGCGFHIGKESIIFVSNVINYFLKCVYDFCAIIYFSTWDSFF